jgi:hypothetical protein
MLAIHGHMNVKFIKKNVDVHTSSGAGQNSSLLVNKYVFYFVTSLLTIILPVVVYGCENWPLTLGNKHRLGGVTEYGPEEDIST